MSHRIPEAPAAARSSARRGLVCTSSSDTPETDALWDPIRGSAFWQNHPARLLSEKLERERDAALSSLAELHAALVRYESAVDAEAPSEHRRMMDRAAACLRSNPK